MSLHLSRQTKLFVQFDSLFFEIPILDGYSFTQAVNTNEITLNEASTSAGASRRGRKMFNTSLAPVEFSFQTYMQPFKAAAGTQGTSGAVGSVANAHHCVEEVLWALFVGRADDILATGANIQDTDNNNLTVSDTTDLNVSFAFSNFSTVGEATFIFSVSDGTSTGGINYEITKGVLNEATIDFDTEGLATISWSGMGSTLKENTTDNRRLRTTSSSATIFEGVDSTNCYVQNKLLTLGVTAVNDGSGPTGVNFQSTLVGAGSGVYNITATGGSITFSNNITYLTPEELGKVNVPIAHVTGTRTISGNFTCYLDEASGGSADLFQEIIEATTLDENVFSITATLGGLVPPNCEIAMGRCNLQVPQHSIEDIISVDVSFDALPSNVQQSGANGASEAALTYKGVAA